MAVVPGPALAEAKGEGLIEKRGKGARLDCPAM